MLHVRLTTDPFDLATYREVACTCIPLLDVLKTEFPEWPETARLYRDTVAIENDITPKTDAEANELRKIDDGVYWVIVYPGDPVTAIITVVAVLALTATILMFMMPQVPTLGSDQESANNSIGNRSNKARPNGRIPDIFGAVISVPELLTVPLLTFENNLEVEICYMCVGRGEYFISGIRDGDTPIALIAGAGVEVYGPDTSPNSGVPQLTVGTPITAPLRDVVRMNEVNGQQLDPPNANAVSGNRDIRFVSPATIQNTGVLDFTEYFGPGDVLTVGNAGFGGSSVILDARTLSSRFYADKSIEFDSFDPTTVYTAGMQLTISNAGFAGPGAGGAVIYIDVSGTYTIASVTSTHIYLV